MIEMIFFFILKVKTQLSNNFLATSSVQILGSKKRVIATSNNMSFALKKL